MKKYMVKVNGKEYVVEVEELREEKSISENSVTHNITQKSEKIKGIKEKMILAPMAGNIVKINVSEGDKIDVGAKVLVLEAMKMENEITTNKAGVIKRILVKVGDTVKGKEPLLELED